MKHAIIKFLSNKETKLKAKPWINDKRLSKAKEEKTKPIKNI